MKLTTKSRYAVIALIHVAEHSRGKPVKLSEISEKELIPLSYLEQIFLKLKRAKIVEAVKGPGGGYKIVDQLDSLSIITVMDAVDENIKMTSCKSSKACLNISGRCKTHNLWSGLGKQIRSYLSSITVADIVENNIAI